MRLIPSLAGSAFAAASLAGAAAPTPASPATPAEACAYRCTPRYAETIAFVEKLAAASPLLRLSYFGETSEGYRIPLVVASKEGLFDAAAARASGKPIVLVYSGIHAGEIDGKDASLALLRDIATGAGGGSAAAILDRLVLLVVPIYNVDGHERFGPNNRLAQDGPVEGMGFRTNGRGLDLNRDFVKMEAPETAALVGGLFHAWRPHVVLDCHVTDGMDFQYDMTFYAGEGLNAPAPLRDAVAGFKEAIRKGLRAAGHKSAPWGDLEDPGAPAKGMKVWASSPRFSTAYFEARNRVSLLAESHAHKPFDVRVSATAGMIRAILDRVAADPEGLLAAIRKSEEETIARAGSFPFTLRSTVSGPAEWVDYEGWESATALSEVTGEIRILPDHARPVTWRIPIYTRHVPTLQVRTPRGYFVGRAWGDVAEKAFLHGLRVERTAAEAEIEVEVFRASKMTWAARTYQGHRAATAEGTWQREVRRLPAGTWWIPLDQPDAAVAVWMLEPLSGDGLLHWNRFDNILERKMVVEDHVVETMAAEALRDPKVRAEYEAALAADPALRADPNGRLEWFYRRSPYFDREVGVYPVFRAVAAPAVATITWSPPAAAAPPAGR